ncbi:hypothetical protein KFZ56_17630 [Virgibacillus sp. NKC19-3]|uniref:hypothetical protein n=1 Tax=Virgibacillus saliphilus TaxID=2831674 RepID=UPI001C9A68C0|nr:hypothetical protein [Virgibacillus sp. NKC19-3]MBY7144843.1 hypothetical protein [Virgibacillus sp. NKC19-3]
MGAVAELLRIMIIFVLCGALGWVVIEPIYTANEVSEAYSWTGALAILIFLFVLYRNKWQFTGWYKGKDKRKLSKQVSITLIAISIILVILPFILSSLLS